MVWGLMMLQPLGAEVLSIVACNLQLLGLITGWVLLPPPSPQGRVKRHLLGEPPEWVVGTTVPGALQGPCHPTSSSPRHHFSHLCLVSVLSCLVSPPSWPYPAIAWTQTIVRGSKGVKDGALTLLLDEFENMSVTRSNSLRRDSPPPPARAHQENGLLEERAAPARVAPDKAGGRGRATGHSEAGSGSGDRRRVGPEKRPKSSREGPGGPQEASRDKRPLSGPDVSTPQPASLASGAKLAAGRPFNTYPRADTDHPPRGAQVTFPSPATSHPLCISHADHLPS